MRSATLGFHSMRPARPMCYLSLVGNRCERFRPGKHNPLIAELNRAKELSIIYRGLDVLELTRVARCILPIVNA